MDRGELSHRGIVDSALQSHKDASLRWDSATYPNESHDSVVLKSYLDALRMVAGTRHTPVEQAQPPVVA